MRRQLDEGKYLILEIWANSVDFHRSPTFFPWDPISPCGQKDYNSVINVERSPAVSRLFLIRVVDFS